MISVQFLKNSAVTETIGCELWGLTKECGQVDVTVCHRHLVLHIEHLAAKHVITVLHILVSHTTHICYCIIYCQQPVSADQR